MNSNTEKPALPLRRIITSLLGSVLIFLACFFFIGAADNHTVTFYWKDTAFEVLAPEFIYLSAILPFVWLLSARSLSDFPFFQRIINHSLRLLTLSVIILALLQISVLDEDFPPTSTVFLVDTSASITDQALEQTRDYILEAISHRRQEDHYQVVAFAKHPYGVSLEDIESRGTIPRPDHPDDALETNISAAIRLSYGLFDPLHTKHIVLISDGNETREDVLTEVHRAHRHGIAISTKGVDVTPPPEVFIKDFDVPKTINTGEPFDAIARVYSTHQDTITLNLSHDDNTVIVSQTLDIKTGYNEVPLRVELDKRGFQTLILTMDVAGNDTILANNTFQYAIFVHGEPQVLYIEGEPRAASHLERALKNEGFDVERRGPEHIGSLLSELSQFDLVIFSDVSPNALSAQQMQRVDQYVHDGGGFIMLGGENTVQHGGFTNTPIEAMLPVTFLPEAKKDTSTVALLLLIDKSGSMAGERIELAKEAARAAVDTLKPDNLVGVIAFDNHPHTVVSMQRASNRSRIASHLQRLTYGGGTDVAAALRLAYQQLATANAQIRHVILLSDGISGADDIFTRTLPAMRLSDITVTSVSIGHDSDTTMLRRIAAQTGGKFYVASTPYQIPRIFTEETSRVTDQSLHEELLYVQIMQRARVLEGIPWSSVPPLMGYVRAEQKPRSELLLAAEATSPILVRWQYGLGKSAFFASDAKNRWASRWLSWPGYGKLWAQLARDTLRSDDRTLFPIQTTRIHDKVYVQVDALDAADQFINGLDSTLDITTPDGNSQSIPLKQTMPGRYEATFTLAEYGAYQLHARHKVGDETLAHSYAGIAYPCPDELRSTSLNELMLSRAADIGGGQFNPPPAAIHAPDNARVYTRTSMSWIFLLAALVMFLVDIACRRIRFFPASSLSWHNANQSMVFIGLVLDASPTKG